jgi:hypothetical protein
MLLMNGDKAFVHPVTGVRIQPFQWYEGFAHQEHEEGLEIESLVQEQDEQTIENNEERNQEEVKKKGKKAGA